MGVYAGALNTVGLDNTFIGSGAGYKNTTGSDNIMIDANAGDQNTTGAGNTIMGESAFRDNSIGNYNTAVGIWALNLNTIGQRNTMIGAFTGNDNDEYQDCTFVGYSIGTEVDNDLHNSSGFGFLTKMTTSNQIRLGNDFVTSIRGYDDWTNISDGRYKKNIEENVKGLEFISKLRPVTYNLDVTGLNKKLYSEEEARLIDQDAVYKKEHILYSGFIAQEVETAALELGYEFSGVDAPDNDHDFYGLRYAQFVVPLVKAVQEQQTMIEDKDQQIATLQSAVADLQAKMELLARSFPELNNTEGNEQSKSSVVELSSARLEQNFPNPFNQNTTISYYIPESSVNASIQIISSRGEILKSVSLNEKGNGKLILKAGELSSGSYTYQLLIDGRVIDSKQMELIK